MNFVSTAAPIDLHLQATSYAIDKETALSSIFTDDIDNGTRTAPWDIGADELVAVTAVELSSFEARGWDSSVELSWETASELDNLGFHVYRALSERGPYERITRFAIPGLGSSPAGARYGYTDRDVANGTTYFYQLEDIETTGKTERHGPVSATPVSGASPEHPSSAGAIEYGTSSESVLKVLRRTEKEIVLELTTEGFDARVGEDGTVSLSVPGFEISGEPGSPAVPVKRSWVDVVAGLGVRLGAVRAEDVEVFSSMPVSAADAFEVEASRDGTVRAGRRIRGKSAAFRRSRLYPEQAARILEQGYQGETARALLELAPLRWDRNTGRILLARRLTVRLLLAGPEPSHHRETASHRKITGVHAPERAGEGALSGPIRGRAGRPSRARERFAPEPTRRVDSVSPRAG